jgi:hypothetical protein
MNNLDYNYEPDTGKLTDVQKEFLRNTHNKLFKALDVKSRAPESD